MKDSLTLRYAGPAVDAGRMDAYEAAGNIMAFADFLAASARAVHGPQATIKTEVRAFEHGSFAVQFALEIGGLMATLFSGVANPKDLYDVVRQSFDLWRHLGGIDPKSTAAVDDKHVRVENHHGVVTVYRAEVINIVTSPEASAAAKRFISRPLEGDIDGVSIEREHEVIASAAKADGASIGFLAAREVLTENTVRMWLMLESPTFKGGNKWKFADDRASFWAPIEDKAFLARVARRETLFGQDDALLVEVQIRQSGQPPAAIKTERAIIKVLEHRHAPQQSGLKLE